MVECSDHFIGMDVSKDRHAVAVADGGRDGEVGFSARSARTAVHARAPTSNVVGHHRPLGMGRQRGDQAVEFATGVQDVIATESADGALPYLLSLADTLDEVDPT